VDADGPGAHTAVMVLGPGRCWQVQTTFTLPPGSRGPDDLRAAWGPGLVYGLRAGDVLAVGVRVRAHTGPEAVAAVARRVDALSPLLGVPPPGLLSAEVHRVRGGLRRRGSVMVSGRRRGGGDGGTAGVREPRRPRGPAPVLRRALPEPRTAPPPGL
jgi:hypothetical protein